VKHNFLKIVTCILLFVFLSLVSIAQNKIVVRKNQCCDSLSLRLSVIRHGDTIPYNKLIKNNGLGVSFKNCLTNANAIIISFEISINKGAKQFVQGNIFDFKKAGLKSGGEIIITNCKATCTNEFNESHMVTLPERKIIVEPSE
jgi:hypothetical protein